MMKLQQPLKELNWPRGDGRVGVNGWNGNVSEVLKPAFFAVLKSTKGSPLTQRERPLASTRQIATRVSPLTT